MSKMVLFRVFNYVALVLPATVAVYHVIQRLGIISASQLAWREIAFPLGLTFALTLIALTLCIEEYRHE